MTYSEVLANARTCIGQYCKACPVCNGVACKNQIPGPGAKGVGDTAIRNYNKWADIRVNMDTLCEGGTPDTHVELFGKSHVAEIAQRYNMSESKVKTRLHRIREKLRVYLMQEGIAV